MDSQDFILLEITLQLILLDLEEGKVFSMNAFASFVGLTSSR